MLSFPLPSVNLHPHLVRLVEENDRICQQRWAAIPVRPVQSVGLIGAGWMGASIAAAALQHGIPVTLTDSHSAVRETAAARVRAEWMAEKRLSDEEATALLHRLHVTGDLAAVAAADLVLEVVPENPAIKQEVYAAVEPLLASRAILGTNTSVIAIARLAASLARPERFCGVHFCHPVRHRPLVEIVPGPRTLPETVAAAAGFARSIGKLPLVVGDAAGFVVNRLLNPYLIGALELLREGNRIAEIDDAMTAFGMAFGPLRMFDEIGLDVSLHGGLLMHEAYPGRVRPSPLLVGMVKARRLGRKSGAGFYAYSPELDADSPGSLDPTAEDLVAYWSIQSQPLPPEAIVDRLLLAVVLEAVRILEEGLVETPGAIDLAMVFGLGFPSSRGGLLHWADTLGPRAILDRLKPWSNLGEVMSPPTSLLKMAEEGGSFFRSGNLSE